MKSITNVAANKYLCIRQFLPYILGSIMFMEYFDGAALNIIFPELAAAFHVEPAFMKISLTTYLIAEVIFIPIAGHLSHKIDLKILLISGIFLMLIGAIGSAISINITLLIISRTIQGISAAFITPTCRLFVLKSFDKEIRLTVINKVMGIALIGLVAGPFISAFLVTIYNWEVIFFVFAAFSVFSLVFAYFFIPSSKNITMDRFDIPGYVILSFAFLAFFLFFNITMSNQNITYLHGLFLIISALLFLAYYAWSKKNNNAIIPKILIQDKQFLLGITSNFIFRILFGGLIFTCSYAMQIELGYSLIKTATSLSLYGIGMIAGKPFVSFVTKRYGYKQSLIFNSIVLSILSIFVLFEILYSHLYALYITLFVYGLSSTLHYSAMNIISLNEISSSLHSKANVVLNIIRLLGTTSGISFAALMFEINTASYHVILCIIFSIYSFIGIFGSRLFKKISMG
ncbi:MAG: MFS transporter [Gammaproteobacteria bacterium]|nr:MFS transporter [Gammaproteobacteria bacterium]MCD8543245.1 MFS transporter [Gammaproteobacteria bacterium]